MSPNLSHLDEGGKAHMVDVGNKPETERIAIAGGEAHAARDIRAHSRRRGERGDVLTVAQIAGILGAEDPDSFPVPSLPLSQIGEHRAG
jgi:cyclic pyranopterin phosphate synthase